MRFGYTIIYVANVEATLSFYSDAFGLKQRFLHESKQYGELDTGKTTLAFSSEKLAKANGISFTKNDTNQTAAGFEIALVTDDVDKSYQKACVKGALAVREPIQKPWEQVVAYVRDINGILIEICSPME